MSDIQLVVNHLVPDGMALGPGPKAGPSLIDLRHMPADALRRARVLHVNQATYDEIRRAIEKANSPDIHFKEQ